MSTQPGKKKGGVGGGYCLMKNDRKVAFNGRIYNAALLPKISKARSKRVPRWSADIFE